MADNRKEQERDELHRTIWGIANNLRGSVDGWDFRVYPKTGDVTGSAKRPDVRVRWEFSNTP